MGLFAVGCRMAAIPIFLKLCNLNPATTDLIAAAGSIIATEEFSGAIGETERAIIILDWKGLTLVVILWLLTNRGG